MQKIDNGQILAIVLLIVIFILASLNINKYSSSTLNDLDDVSNIQYNKKTNALVLDSLTLKQKIAQMIVVYSYEENIAKFKMMNIGGIHIGASETKDKLQGEIKNIQKNSVIPFFITVDMEGCINPFENFQEFPSFKEISNEEEAYKAGFEEGKLLKELGININFAPVIDLEDEIWNCRSFLGPPEEIAKKANAYINGLKENDILSTSKHYPGQTLVIKDPHVFVVNAEIREKDLLPFKETIKNGVSAIMVSHIIANGSANSEEKPAVVSENLISNLKKEFGGLVVTDEINMLGLKSFYNNLDQMYIDLFKAENDLVLNFNENPYNIKNMIEVVERAVLRGEISEERIDMSVKKILNAKGIAVK